MRNKPVVLILILSLLTAALLSACSGGANDPQPVSSSIQSSYSAPDSSSSSAVSLPEPESVSSSSSPVQEYQPPLTEGDRYPDMYCAPHGEQESKPRTVYLTFDDGPGAMTEEYLALLKEYDVRATFFVTGSADSAQGRERLKAIAEDGHTLAVHCYSHDYDRIYASKEAYLADFNRIYELIYDATGIRATCFRFPGGSSTGHNKAIRAEVKAEMARRGFEYYDWNVSAADTAGNASREAVFMNITGKVSESKHNIVLAHEGKAHTCAALGDVIANLKSRGFTFEPLTNDVKPYKFA